MITKDNLVKCGDQGWILNVNKPIGKTSFAVVSYIRKLTKIKKVGHAGSLDPNASGVLLVAVGKATRQIYRFMNLEKEYVGTVRFGIVTDTYDIEGSVLEESDVSGIKEQDIRAALQSFSGTIDQVPPRFSALKYKGKPLYKYARSGEYILPESRKVHIHSIELESYLEPEAVIRITCSKGTYIRSIAHDLGQMFDCGAILASLIRERIGEFRMKDALKWEELPAVVDEITIN